MAVAQGLRYVRGNLAHAFPGNPDGDYYESWRPPQITAMTKGRRNVLEIHDRPNATGEYVVIGGAHIGEPLAIAAALGIRNVIYSREPKLVNYSLTTLAVEMCRDDAGNPENKIADNVRRLRTCMGAIATAKLPKPPQDAFDFYVFAGEVHSTRAAALGLQPDKVCQPFSTVPAYVLEKLGLPPDSTDYVFEGWNASGSSQGEWFGTLLRRFRPRVVDLVAQSERPATGFSSIIP